MATLALNLVQYHTSLSGAGHDAMELSHFTKVDMLFVCCRGGISHSPEEHVLDDDGWVVGLAILAFLETNFKNQKFQKWLPSIYMRHLIPGLFAYAAGLQCVLLRFLQTQTVLLPLSLYALGYSTSCSAAYGLLLAESWFRGSSFICCDLILWISFMTLAVYVCKKLCRERGIQRYMDMTFN